VVIDEQELDGMTLPMLLVRCGQLMDKRPYRKFYFKNMIDDDEACMCSDTCFVGLREATDEELAEMAPAVFHNPSAGVVIGIPDAG